MFECDVLSGWLSSQRKDFHFNLYLTSFDKVICMNEKCCWLLLHLNQCFEWTSFRGPLPIFSFPSKTSKALNRKWFRVKDKISFFSIISCFSFWFEKVSQDPHWPAKWTAFNEKLWFFNDRFFEWVFFTFFKIRSNKHQGKLLETLC